MNRRNISTALIACATGAALLPRAAQSLTCTPPCYPETEAEMDLGVTVNTAYPQGNALRYGADPTGATDSTNAIKYAFDLNGGAYVYLPAGTYTTSDSLVLPAHIDFYGDSINGTVINFTPEHGNPEAVDGYPNSTSYSTIHDMTINCQTNACFGIRLGNGTRQVELANLLITGVVAGATASEGVNLNTGTHFSDGVLLRNVTIEGFWKGLHALSNSATNTWTGITLIACFITSTGPLSGSVGIHFDGWTNGVGSRGIGGSIEEFATGIQVDNPNGAGVGFGLAWDGDMESNTTEYSVGTGFAYSITNMATLGIQNVNVQTPTTGFTIVLPQWPRVTKLRPTGTLASGTITLPATPYGGMEVRVTSTQTVTALTVNTGTGTVVNAPTTITATTPFGMVYDATHSEWSRLQ
jgi:hypothetical protein